MFKFLNQGHKLMRIQSSIIAITTLAVLAAVITTLALSSFTAEAQGNPGAVANLQLTSTTAGELTVSWDAASPVPTDYRVDWAKSGEDYKSWKVDDGHVYPDPAPRPPPSRTSPRYRVQDPHACSLLQRRTRRQILGRTMGRSHHHGGRRAGGDAHP